MTRGKGYNIVLRRGVRGLAHYLLERDFDFLVRTVADKRKDPERVKEIIRDKEDLIEIMLDDPKLMAKIRETQEELLFISPYLLFSILLRQVRRQLRQRSFTVEISGRDRIPVFDARQVDELLAAPEIINYLAEMLSSFTKVQSGVIFFRVGEKVKSFRFNTLNLADLAVLATTLPEEERFPVYRRMGDLCLFMAGLFPDYGRRLPDWTRAVGQFRAEDYHALGPRYYRLAAYHPWAEASGYHRVLEKVAANFHLLLKPLQVLAQEHIGFKRAYWFGL